MERPLAKERAEIEGQKQLIEAITKAAVERMAKDPEFAERAIRNHLGASMQRQENKDGVVRHAIEDLKRNSAAEDATPDLDPGFLNKFERHAEDAATEQLREKWGRVLGTEIRKPGTVTPRVMRIVDEIDAETARRFEDLCRWRLKEAVPLCTVGELDILTKARLAGNGLIVEPGMGHIRKFVRSRSDAGNDVWFMDFGRRGIGIPGGTTINPLPDKPLAIQMDGTTPAIAAYIVTDEGMALASILDDQEDAAFNAYVDRLRAAIPEVPLTVYERTNHKQWRPVFDVPLGVR